MKSAFSTALFFLSAFVSSWHIACTAFHPSSAPHITPSSVQAPMMTFDFRKVNWGATMEEVKRSESSTAPWIEKQTQLGYKIDFAGEPAFLFYYFDDGALESAGYVFSKQHSDLNSYIDDYDNVKKRLRYVYGKPVKDDVFWSNPFYENDHKEWGVAIVLGDLKYQTVMEDLTVDDRDASARRSKQQDLPWCQILLQKYIGQVCRTSPRHGLYPWRDVYNGMHMGGFSL